MKGERWSVTGLVPLFLIRGLALILVLVASTASLTYVARASELPETVTIDELLQLLRERSPRLAAERAQIDVAAADLIAAEVLPNPSISYGSTNVVDGKKTPCSKATCNSRAPLKFRCSSPDSGRHDARRPSAGSARLRHEYKRGTLTSPGRSGSSSCRSSRGRRKSARWTRRGAALSELRTS
jgi:hypothetical protein